MLEADGSGGGGGGTGIWAVLSRLVLGTSLEERLEEACEENSWLNSSSERSSPGYVKEVSEV